GKDCVYVCDMGKRTIYSYDFDGKFLQSFSFPYSLVFNDVVELPDGRFLCHRPSEDENCKGLWVLDQKGRRVKNLLEYEKGIPYVHSAWNTLCAQEDGTIKIYNPVDGSYYQYDAVNDTVVRTMRQKSNLPMLADFH
ncbi:6-bladed beta-propeller, partial [Bacteroides fragilis]